jgi:hypothetical protein
MNGTAYYTLSGALLLALDATLSIDGNVVDDARRDPVDIVYKRTLKALPSASSTEAATGSKPTATP